jgi:hypothetical protein
MIDAHQGKPYYIPPKQELMRYADQDYYEQQFSDEPYTVICVFKKEWIR